LRALSDQIAFGVWKQLPMVRRDFLRAVPETFATLDG
jgi:hypothetical protein